MASLQTKTPTINSTNIAKTPTNYPATSLMQTTSTFDNDM